MPDGLYERDALAWAEQQAALLERLSRGERLNAELDWHNIVEEVRDVGLSELRSVRSLLTRALEHLLKLHGWPDSRDSEHWRSEIRHFLTDAQDRWTASMAVRIELAALYKKACLMTAELRIDGAQGVPPPQTCPFTLAELLPGDSVLADIDALRAKLTA